MFQGKPRVIRAASLVMPDSTVLLPDKLLLVHIWVSSHNTHICIANSLIIVDYLYPSLDLGSELDDIGIVYGLLVSQVD